MNPIRVALTAALLAAPGLPAPAEARDPVTASDAPQSPQRAKVRESIERARKNDAGTCVLAKARKPEEAPAGAPDPEGRDMREIDMEGPEAADGVAFYLDDCPSKRKERAAEAPVSEVRP